MDNQNVKHICFPNTVKEDEQKSYSIEDGMEIVRIVKNGEMGQVGWFEVKEKGALVAEIKESVCNVFYEGS